VGVAESYARVMTALLPPGKLWRLLASTLEGLMLGCADELARIHARVGDLLNEMDPATASELLPDYEAELALVPAATIDERRANIVALEVRRQRFRPADFQTALAPLLGLTPAGVVIVERTRDFAIAVGDCREIYRFFIYRDPTLPGSYFLASAQAQVERMQPSHTAGTVIESINLLCDDPHSLCDRDVLGA
jgi:uncharacterized protein YmfQ (DUF2313 family)